MKLINPDGEKTITIKNKEKLCIQIEDFDSGNRSFSLTINLEGDHSECHIIGRCQTKGTDEKKWTLLQRFLGTSQIGSIDIRGTAENKSRIECNAQGILEQGSHQATANISERVILFDQARSKLLPVLTVKTDDVAAASHGATVAPVEPEKILYLQGKGISKATAETMVKEGFLR